MTAMLCFNNTSHILEFIGFPYNYYSILCTILCVAKCGAPSTYILNINDRSSYRFDEYIVVDAK